MRRERYNIMEISVENADGSRTTPEPRPESKIGPSQQLAKPIKKRDRSGVNFRKRWRTLVKTGCELYQDYGARIYLVLIPRI
ncbi:hypothetical protein B0T14DRAFT_508351 [Immersiella caudata]|uniref:Uncharacterized protein n=1 Tax=Immersiella caudata TaxID=314043 RepID=A0AA39XHG4_9PEZI|nr:hypothetical protein B0T14DRAFT_508351 [Immersiella caudata]